MDHALPRHRLPANSQLVAARLERSLLLGHEKVAVQLVEAGGEELAGRDRPLQPLLAAIRPAGPRKTDRVRERLVALLLAAGADPNRSYAGITPLMLAAGHGTVAIVEALVTAGADVSALDHQGRNALHHAAAANQPVDLIVPLLEAGIRPDLEDPRTGLTPLAHYARHRNPTACRALLAAGGDPGSRPGPLPATGEPPHPARP